MTGEEARKLMDALADIMKAPYHLLEQELQGTYSFSMGHYPKEVFTDDDPPLELSKGSEIIPIDAYLGLYVPDTQEITIFQKGIVQASDILQVNPKHLEIIVRIHEWAHAIVHLGLTKDDCLKVLKDDSCWGVLFSSSTKLYKAIEHSLHELLAQVLTLYCIQGLKKDAKTDAGRQASERIERAFHSVSSRQPPEYRIADLLDVERNRVRKSIGLLRSRGLAGKASAWKTVVTW